MTADSSFKVPPAWRAPCPELCAIEGPQPPCPDCSAVGTGPGGQELKHDETCPIGLGIDEQMAADRLFFERRPGIDRYFRAPCWAEEQELRLLTDAPKGSAITGKVTVSRGPEDGVRWRDFAGIRWVPAVPTSAPAGAEEASRYHSVVHDQTCPKTIPLPPEPVRALGCPCGGTLLLVCGHCEQVVLIVINRPDQPVCEHARPYLDGAT